MTLDERIEAAQVRVLAEAPVIEIAPATLTAEALAALIDHTLLKPEAGEEQIRAHIVEAVEFGFAAVCINPIWTPEHFQDNYHGDGCQQSPSGRHWANPLAVFDNPKGLVPASPNLGKNFLHHIVDVEASTSQSRIDSAQVV